MSPHPAPLSAALGILLTAAVIALLWSNERLTGGYASANRDATLTGQTRQQELMAELIKQQAALAALSERMVRVQETFADFSDKQVRARREQGYQEKLRTDYCGRGVIRGKLCENLPDPNLLELLTR